MLNLDLLSELLDKALAKETEQSWNEHYEHYLIEKGRCTFAKVMVRCSSVTQSGEFVDCEKSFNEGEYAFSA